MSEMRFFCPSLEEPIPIAAGNDRLSFFGTEIIEGRSQRHVPKNSYKKILKFRIEINYTNKRMRTCFYTANIISRHKKKPLEPSIGFYPELTVNTSET